jgi:hypothetical protein
MSNNSFKNVYRSHNSLHLHLNIVVLLAMLVGCNRQPAQKIKATGIIYGDVALSFSANPYILEQFSASEPANIPYTPLNITAQYTPKDDWATKIASIDMIISDNSGDVVMQWLNKPLGAFIHPSYVNTQKWYGTVDATNENENVPLNMGTLGTRFFAPPYYNPYTITVRYKLTGGDTFEESQEFSVFFKKAGELWGDEDRLKDYVGYTYSTIRALTNAQLSPNKLVDLAEIRDILNSTHPTYTAAKCPDIVCKSDCCPETTSTAIGIPSQITIGATNYMGYGHFNKNDQWPFSGAFIDELFHWKTNLTVGGGTAYTHNDDPKFDASLSNSREFLNKILTGLCS